MAKKSIYGWLEDSNGTIKDPTVASIMKVLCSHDILTNLATQNLYKYIRKLEEKLDNQADVE